MFLSLHYCKRLLVAVSVLRRVASAAAAVEFGSRSSSSSDSRVGKQIFCCAGGLASIRISAHASTLNSIISLAMV